MSRVTNATKIRLSTAAFTEASDAAQARPARPTAAQPGTPELGLQFVLNTLALL